MLFDFASRHRGDAVDAVAQRPPLHGTPYQFLGSRPFREARLRSYLVAQHRAGRPLSAVLDDPYVHRCGTRSFCWRVLADRRTLEAIERNIHDAFEECRR